MYMAYGWPKTLPTTVGPSHSSQPVVHLGIAQGLLLLVSSTHIQIWGANQHKIKLGQYIRDTKSVEAEGVNVQAVWSSNTTTVAVLTSGNFLQFYVISQSGKQLRVSGESSPGLTIVWIRFVSSTSLPLFDRTLTVGSLTADDSNIILGLSNGFLHLVAWNGEFIGAADLFEGLLATIGPSYVPEANGSPHSPLMAALPSANNFNSGRVPSNGFLHLEVSKLLRILVAVFLDGRVLLSSINRKGLKQVQDITPEKWIGVHDGVCTSIAQEQQIVAVGTRRGTVELFNLTDSASLLRSVSLSDWGYSVEDTGSVNCIRWTPDNSAFAVGWRHRGLAVWSLSGCRLMCTIRQGSMSNVFSYASPYAGNDMSRNEPMVSGVAALSWGEHGYQLFSIEQGHVSKLIEFPFAKSCLSRSFAGISHVWQLLKAEDRLLLLKADEEDELKVHHLVIPQSYIGVNWPIRHVAANEDGTYLAIAGRQGLILHDLRSKRWRVFGDVTQERQIQCAGLLWLGKIVVVCNFCESTKMYELILYPRYHLDETSLLYRKQLLDKPIAMDVWEEYILVACPPFDIRVFHVHVHGNLSPLRTATIKLTTVRELSIMSARKPPIAMQFVPNLTPNEVTTTNIQEGRRDFVADAVLRQPTRCMLLRTDGELSLLDLDQGSERRLVSGVERFWLTCGRPKEEANLIKEVPWWAYGHRGMQVWYPSSEIDGSHAQDLLQLDPELDFDREVYPLGLCPSAGVIVGVSQRLALTACAEMPCFEPTPQAQPILPCLLRHLLQRDKMDEAIQLAKLSAGRPHFSHSLEWLLFTVFDAAMSSHSTNKKRGKSNPMKNILQSYEEHKLVPRLLQQVCDLIRHFPDYLDVVVSVARKTDSRHWPELFAAAGKSTELFEECCERRCYRTATCYILVIEKLEGPVISQLSAVRLLQATLEVSMYELAGDLVRFLLRCGKEHEHGDKEAEKGSSSLLTSFFLGLKGPAPSPPVEPNMHYSTVKTILGEHANFLMARKELPELVAFVRSTQFDIREFLQSENGKSARLDDFSSALKIIGEQFNMDILQSRLDAEFLFTHMCAVGFREWIVVLATILEKTEVLLDLFRGDSSLWQAYKRTMQAQENHFEFEDFLKVLQNDLGVVELD